MLLKQLFDIHILQQMLEKWIMNTFYKRLGKCKYPLGYLSRSSSRSWAPRIHSDWCLPAPKLPAHSECNNIFIRIQAYFLHVRGQEEKSSWGANCQWCLGGLCWAMQKQVILRHHYRMVKPSEFGVWDDGFWSIFWKSWPQLFCFSLISKWNII